MFYPAVLSIDHILVHLSGLGAGNCDLKELCADTLGHLLFLPAVELADDRDLDRLRGKSSEYYAVVNDVCPQIFICVVNIAHIKLLKIHNIPL